MPEAVPNINETGVGVGQHIIRERVPAGMRVEFARAGGFAVAPVDGDVGVDREVVHHVAHALRRHLVRLATREHILAVAVSVPLRAGVLAK